MYRALFIVLIGSILTACAMPRGYELSRQQASYREVAGKINSENEFRAELAYNSQEIGKIISGKASPKDSDKKSIDNVNDIGPFVPWPPPTPTSLYVYPEDVTSKFHGRNIGEIADALTRSIAKSGYDEASFFTAPGGFTLATRVEQVDDAGRSVLGATRWVIGDISKPSSISDYFFSLLHAKQGRFRLFVFVFTTDPKIQNGSSSNFDDAKRWSKTGMQFLPSKIRSLKISKDARLAVLLYEYICEKGKKPYQLDSPTVAIFEQLSSSGIKIE